MHLDPSDPGDRRIIARQVAAARDAGRRGDHRARTTRGRPDLEAAYDEGAASRTPAEKPAPGRPGAAAAAAFRDSGSFLSRGSWRPRASLPSRGRDAGGFLAGLLLYTAVITYVRYGPSGWTGWLSAKFLNKPMQGHPGKGGPAKESAA